MDKQPQNNTTKVSQPKRWSDAEVRRVARVFDLLIKIDQRKKGKGNEQKTTNQDKQDS